MQSQNNGCTFRKENIGVIRKGVKKNIFFIVGIKKGFIFAPAKRKREKGFWNEM